MFNKWRASSIYIDLRVKNCYFSLNQAINSRPVVILAGLNTNPEIDYENIKIFIKVFDILRCQNKI